MIISLTKIIITNMGKIYAFIDSQNLNLSVLDQGWKLDFKKFRIYLKDKYRVDRAFIFIGFIKNNVNLYKFLRQSGYTLIFKPTIQYPQNEVSHLKGNIDAELVLQAMIEYKNYSHSIIVSGDGDFYCLIKYLNKNEKLLKLIIPNQNRYSALLKKFTNEIASLNNLKQKLEYKKSQ